MITHNKQYVINTPPTNFLVFPPVIALTSNSLNMKRLFSLQELWKIPIIAPRIILKNISPTITIVAVWSITSPTGLKISGRLSACFMSKLFPNSFFGNSYLVPIGHISLHFLHFPLVSQIKPPEQGTHSTPYPPTNPCGQYSQVLWKQFLESSLKY